MALPPFKQTESGNPPKQSARSLPALQALLIQIVSLVALYALLLLAWILTGFQASLFVAAVLQGAIAACLSRVRHLAGWWIAIQFFFPLAVLLTHALAFPPYVFLTAFLLLLGFYWTTFRTQVPLYLSGPKVWEAVADLLPQRGTLRLVDIGSGLGGLLLDIEKRRPDITSVGVELAPIPWFISWLRARFARSRVSFMRSDYSLLDFSQFDVVFAYLSPAVMDAVWQKTVSEMRPGTLLLSYEFPVSGIKPDIVVEMELDGSIIYGWRMPNISLQ